VIEDPALFALEGGGTMFAARFSISGFVTNRTTSCNIRHIDQMVLTGSDEDWEHAPEYRGFRSMLGTR
jgi:hypothetical protein